VLHDAFQDVSRRWLGPRRAIALHDKVRRWRSRTAAALHRAGR
jgi:hypothetical protein